MRRNGFTLIELLVVVAIIGILAAVGVVAYSGYTKNAKFIAVQENFETISQNAEIMALDCDLKGTMTAISNAHGQKLHSFTCINENTNSLSHVLRDHYHFLGFINPLTNYSATWWFGTPVGMAITNKDGYIIFEGQPTSKCEIEISTTVPNPSTGKTDKLIHIISMHGRVSQCP
jgi:prepilin-type N-terminal cleavage/methylation domain-containing protein